MDSPVSATYALADRETGPQSPIQSIAIIGAGHLGRAFALRCAATGFDVVLEDVMPSRLRAAQEELASVDGISAGQVRLASTVEEAVREADLAIDFMPDELESKLEIFSMLDRMAPPKTILCTPTQVLSITDLASCTYRPELCVALDGFAGALTGGEVRLIRGRAAGNGTLVSVRPWLRRLGHAVEVVEDDRDPLLTATVR